MDILVAVSGGADSVALLRALVQLKTDAENDPGTGKIIVAHCNHKTREACADEAKFVETLCEVHGVECVVLEYSTDADSSISPTSNSEESLRNWRYQQLLDLAKRRGIRYLFTGHHQDDQIETVLFRLIRGTGLSGLAGVPAIRVDESVSIVRPLLKISRVQIEEALADLNQEYCTDISNQDSAYSRNFIRNELLPKIRNRFGNSIDASVARISIQARELDAFLDVEISKVASLCVLNCNATQIQIDTEACKSLPPIILRHLLKTEWRKAAWPEQAMTYDWWQALCELAQDNRSESQNLPGNVIVKREGRVLTLSR